VLKLGFYYGLEVGNLTEFLGWPYPKIELGRDVLGEKQKHTSLGGKESLGGEQFTYCLSFIVKDL
jgi:hypothetical protein